MVNHCYFQVKLVFIVCPYIWVSSSSPKTCRLDPLAFLKRLTVHCFPAMDYNPVCHLKSAGIDSHMTSSIENDCFFFFILYYKSTTPDLFLHRFLHVQSHRLLVVSAAPLLWRAERRAGSCLPAPEGGDPLRQPRVLDPGQVSFQLETRWLLHNNDYVLWCMWIDTNTGILFNLVENFWIRFI